MKQGILYWITGLSGAGKTTIGNRLYYELRKKGDNVILLDGDILKKIVDGNHGYSIEERKKRAIKYAMLCKMLTDQDATVICCTIAMFDEVREWNRKYNKGYVEVFLDVPLDVLKQRDQKGLYSKCISGQEHNVMGMDMQVEFPKNPDITIVNDGRYSIKKCVDEILKHDVTFSSDFDRDTEYWNSFYISSSDIEEPSLFAKEVGEMVKESHSLLELGCGNGRDSRYFFQKGLNVTAIDASNVAIEELQSRYKDKGNMCFICDDFVVSSMIYAGQYDYCYSRFSLHAINEEQEIEVLRNVYKVLKEGGKFFIEVRSVNDDLYGKGKKVGKDSYIYGGHFRRFIRIEELKERVQNAGFHITYASEAKGFAPFKDEDPLIIRMILEK